MLSQEAKRKRETSRPEDEGYERETAAAAQRAQNFAKFRRCWRSIRVPPYPPTHGIVLSIIIKVLSVFPPSLDDRWRYAMALASVLLVLAPVVVGGGVGV